MMTLGTYLRLGYLLLINYSLIIMFLVVGLEVGIEKLKNLQIMIENKDIVMFYLHSGLYIYMLHHIIDTRSLQQIPTN